MDDCCLPNSSYREPHCCLPLTGAFCRIELVWSLTLGQVGDRPEGHKLVEAIGLQEALVYLLMDSAYEALLYCSKSIGRWWCQDSFLAESPRL